MLLINSNSRGNFDELFGNTLCMKPGGNNKLKISNFSNAFTFKDI